MRIIWGIINVLIFLAFGFNYKDPLFWAVFFIVQAIFIVGNYIAIKIDNKKG